MIVLANVSNIFKYFLYGIGGTLLMGFALLFIASIFILIDMSNDDFDNL